MAKKTKFRFPWLLAFMVIYAVAALVGIFMNAVLPGKDYEFGANEQGDTAVNFGARNN